MKKIMAGVLFSALASVAIAAGSGTMAGQYDADHAEKVMPEAVMVATAGQYDADHAEKVMPEVVVSATAMTKTDNEVNQKLVGDGSEYSECDWRVPADCAVRP